MQSPLICVAVLAAAVAASHCGGGDSTPTPTNPGTSNPTPSTLTVSIVGIKGNTSYVPNPVPLTSGAQVAFQNNDTVSHRIVMDDNSADFGTLAPGASSQARAVSGNFHCTNHPSMVGSIGGQAAPEPPPGSGDGY